MKLAIIGLIAVLMLGGGAAGAYFYFSKPAEAASGEVAEHEKADEKAAAHGQPAAEVYFVDMEPLTLPVIEERGVNQGVSLVITLEVPNHETSERARLMSPRLKDAYIQDMYGMLSRHASMKDGVLEVAKIKARLNAVSARVLGDENVNDVLLQVVNQRRI